MVDLEGAVLNILALIAGAIVGAQIGPALSRRVSGPWHMRVLASTLGPVGVRLAASLLT